MEFKEWFIKECEENLKEENSYFDDEEESNDYIHFLEKKIEFLFNKLKNGEKI